MHFQNVITERIISLTVSHFFPQWIRCQRWSDKTEDGRWKAQSIYGSSVWVPWEDLLGFCWWNFNGDRKLWKMPKVLRFSVQRGQILTCTPTIDICCSAISGNSVATLPVSRVIEATSFYCRNCSELLLFICGIYIVVSWRPLAVIAHLRSLATCR